MDIIQRIAQLEREQIGERVYRDASEGEGRQGLLGSPAPYGYRYDDGHLESIDRELEVVEQLYRRYLDGDSLGDLVKWLEKQRIGTKKEEKMGQKRRVRVSFPIRYTAAFLNGDCGVSQSAAGGVAGDVQRGAAGKAWGKRGGWGQLCGVQRPRQAYFMKKLYLI